MIFLGQVIKEDNKVTLKLVHVRKKVTFYNEKRS